MAGWKQQVRQSGMVSTRSLVKAAGDQRPPEAASVKEEKRRKQADICINCTKPECRGGDACFKKRRKERECETDGSLSER